MFDISARLVSEQDEISGLETIGWETHSWRYLSLVKKESQSSTHEGLRLFRFCFVLWEDFRKPLNLTMHGSKDSDGSQLLKATETLTESMESRLNSSGTSSQDWIRCSSATKSTITVQIGRNTREVHRKNPIHVDVQ